MNFDVEVCEPVFSEEILDLNNVSNGEFSVQKVKILRITMTVISLNVSQMSLCSDYTEGGAEVMVFTNKINFSRSNFYADFFQLNDAEDEDSKIWRSRVVIQEADLHTVGQHLGRQSVVILVRPVNI